MSEEKRFSIKLIDEYERPHIEIKGFLTLIDTGAIVPMMALPIVAVERVFYGELVKSDVNISGIGGVCYGDVYKLRNFEIGEMNFKTIEFFVPKDITPFENKPILLSAPLFHNTKYNIDTINNKFTIAYPEDLDITSKEFNLLDLKGKLYAQIDGVLIQEGGTEKYQVINYTQSDIGYEKIIEYTEDNIDNSLDNILNEALEDSGLQNELVNDNFDNVENNSTDVINDNVEIDSNNIEGSYDDMDYDDDDGIDRE